MVFTILLQYELVMYIEYKKRKKIQTVLEEFVKNQPSLADKKFALVILSFIYELNEQNAAVTASERGLECPHNDGVCLWQHIKELQSAFSMLEVPEVVYKSYLDAFALLTRHIDLLSDALNLLSKLLHLIYVESSTQSIQSEMMQ